MSNELTGTPSPAERATSVAKAALLLGVAEKTLYQWRARGCPWKANGEFPIDTMQLWHGEHVGRTKPTRGEAGSGPPAMLRADAEARKAAAAAELIELKVLRARGQLIDVDEVRRAVGQHYIAAKCHLNDLSHRILATVKLRVPDRHRALAAIESTIADFLDAMSDAIKEVDKVSASQSGKQSRRGQGKQPASRTRTK